MADLKKLNDAAKTYQGMQDPDWRVGKKKDLKAFTAGATETPDLGITKGISKLGDKMKRAWGEFKK